MKYKANKLVATKTPTQLPGGGLLLIFESHGSDDYYSNNVWSHYSPNEFDFSSNIKIVAATYVFNGCAVVVEKIDPTIIEEFEIFDPHNGQNIKVTF